MTDLRAKSIKLQKSDSNNPELLNFENLDVVIKIDVTKVRSKSIELQKSDSNKSDIQDNKIDVTDIKWKSIRELSKCDKKIR